MESRIREIRSSAQERREQRAEAAAKQKAREGDAETRQEISPNDLAARQRRIELIDRNAKIYEARCRNEDIEEMARIKQEYWSASPRRKAVIVERYALLYSRHGDQVAPEQISKSFEIERRREIVSKIFAAAAGEGSDGN